MAEKKKKTATKKPAVKKVAFKKTLPAKKTDAEKKPVDRQPIEKIAPIAKSSPKEEKKRLDYLYAVGRRKTAVAQVRVYKKGSGEILINEMDYQKYFPTLDLQERVTAALRVVGQMQKLMTTAKVSGGGIAAQADAVRHGMSRALIQLNPNFRKPLKKSGFLTRDARKKERKKPGLKRARKRPQWQKR